MFHNKKDLTRFLAVAESGNVLAAAEQLGLTQPALSYAISMIEKRFGVPLFERLQRGVRLTPVGHAAVECARRLLHEYEASEKWLESLLAGRAGRLRVVAGPVFMQAVLPGAIGRFHDDYPDVEVDVLHADGADALRLLTHGETDLYCGVLDDGALPASLRREPLPVMKAAIVAHRDHPLHKRQPTWDDLPDYPWVDYGGGLSRAGNRPAALLAEIRRRTGRPVKRLVHSDSAGLFLMEAGPYLAQLPLAFLDRLPSRFLKPLSVEFGTCSVRAAIVSRRDAAPPVAFRRLREIVRENARA